MFPNALRKLRSHTRPQVPHLYVDEATLAGERLVLARMGAADPRAGGVIPVLIGERPFENEDLLAAHVHVRVELGPRLPTHQRDVLAAKFV